MINSKKPAKKAVRLGLMIAGQSGLGKTSLLQTLFYPHLAIPLERTVEIYKTTLGSPY